MKCVNDAPLYIDAVINASAIRANSISACAQFNGKIIIASKWKILFPRRGSREQKRRVEIELVLVVSKAAA